MKRSIATFIAVAAGHLVFSALAYLYLMAGVLPAAMDAGSSYGNRLLDIMSLLLLAPIVLLRLIGDVIGCYFIVIVGKWIEHLAELAMTPPFYFIGIPLNSALSAFVLMWIVKKAKALKRRSTEPKVRQVSSEGAPSAPPDEPST